MTYEDFDFLFDDFGVKIERKDGNMIVALYTGDDGYFGEEPVMRFDAFWIAGIIDLLMQVDRSLPKNYVRFKVRRKK